LTILRNPFAELAAMERNVERIFSEVLARLPLAVLGADRELILSTEIGRITT
jgi:hypothetical protein